MNLRHGRSVVLRSTHRFAAGLTLLGVMLAGCGQAGDGDEPVVVPTQEDAAGSARPGNDGSIAAPSDDPRDDHFAPVLDTALGPAGAGRLGRSATLLSTIRRGHRRVIAAFADRGQSASAHDALAPMAMWFARSDDGGETWARGTLAPPSQDFMAIRDIVGDPALASSRPRMVDQNTSSSVYYAAVATLDGIDPHATRAVVISRSIDGGETFGVPDIAVVPTPFAPFGTADSPSIAVDAGGIVHMTFVSDQGTDHAAIQYWVGTPGPDECGATCINWRQGPSPALHNDRDVPNVRHPLIRTFRRMVYVAYEVRQTIPGETPGNADGTWTLLAARLNPFSYVWEPMTERPTDTGSQRFHTHTLAAGGFEPAEVDRLFDFAIDPLSGGGTFAWVAKSPDGTGDALGVRSFQIQHAVAETWGDVQRFDASDAVRAGSDLNVSVAAEAGLRAVSWFRQDAETGRVRLMGAQSFDAGAMWTPPRNLTPLTGRPRDASMPACGNTDDPWRALAATTLVPRGDNRLAALTVHFDTGAADCPAAGASSDQWVAALAATRWRGQDSVPSLAGRTFYP